MATSKKVTKKSQKSGRKPATSKTVPQYIQPDEEELLTERNVSPRFLESSPTWY